MTFRWKTFATRLGSMGLAALCWSTLPACGKTLDLGRDPRPGCEAEPSSPRVLSSFETLPDFSPQVAVIVGDSVYVGGLTFPGRTFDDIARDVGRVYRFPLEGGSPTEVWRGQWFRPPLKANGSRIAFAELDPSNQPTFRVYAGLHVLDTERGTTVDVPNLPGRDYVVDFAMTTDEVVFSSASNIVVGPDGRHTELPGYPIARYRFDEGTSREVFVHPTSAAGLFVHDGRIEAVYPADSSRSGYDAPSTPSSGLDLAAFAIGESGVSVVRRFTDIPRAPDTNYAVVHADDSSYFVSATSNGSTTTRRYPALPGAAPNAIGGPSYGFPVFDAGRALEVSFADRSAIREVDASSTSESPGTEVAFDARRQVFSVAVDACRVAWLSTTSSSPETYRLTVGARP